MLDVRDFVESWKNWSSYFTYFPRQVFQPTDVNEIADVIKKAKSDARHARVAGSRWSYSDIAVTHDYVINVARLPRILAFAQGTRAWGHIFPPAKTPPPIFPKVSPVLPHALLPAVTHDGTRLFAHIEAGVTIKQIHSSLDQPQDDIDIGFGLGRAPWALPTFGGSDGQTVVGAVATSTHGGDLGAPPLQEMVRAIHLVDANGVQHWIEGAGPRAITDPSKLAASLPGVVIHYDDGLFLSALVAMGCLGVTYSLVIELVPQYGLFQATATAPWPVVRAWLSGDQFTKVPLAADQGAFGPATHFIEILMNPYRKTDDYTNPDPTAARTCIITMRHLAGGTPLDPPPPPQIPLPDLGKILDIVNKVWGTLHGDQKAARETVDTALGYLRMDRRTLTSSTKAFKVQGSGGFMPVQSVEFAISTRDDQHVSFLSALLDGFDDICKDDRNNAFAGGLSIRITLPTEAYLGIQQRASNPFAPPKVERVCHVEVITAMKLNLDVNNYFDPRDFQGRSALYVRGFEEIASKYPDAHLHWGMLSLTNLHQPSRYVGVSSWMPARNALVGPSRVFDNDFTVRYGISRKAPNWAVLSAAPPQDLPRSHSVDMTPELLPGSPTTHPDDAGPADLYPPTLFSNAANELEAVVLGSDGQACWNQRNLSSQGKEVWSGWQVLSAAEPAIKDELNRRMHFVGRVAEATNADGHVEIFARCGDTNRIFHAWRTSPLGADWHRDQGFNVKEPRSYWFEMDKDAFASSPDVTLDGDGHLHLIGRTTKADILRRCQNPSGWSAWETLRKNKIQFVGDPAIVSGAARVLTVVCRDASGRMWFSRQSKPESGASWSDWAMLGTPKITLLGDPVAVRDATPRVQVFALGTGPSGGTDLFEIKEMTPNTTWDADWSVVPTGVPPLDGRRPSAILDRGAVHIAFLDKRREVRHLFESSGSWTAQALGGLFTSFPSVIANPDGRIEICVKFANDLAQHRWQLSPGKW